MLKINKKMKSYSNRKKSMLLILAVFTLNNLFSQTITIQNPILAGFYPDPSIVKVESDYYLINSTFSYFPGIPIFHSKDLKNWQQIGNVIDRPSQMDFMGEKLTRGLFAPSISYYKGMYYVTCTDVDHLGNFVVTSVSPAGPWSDPVLLPKVKGIDPSLFFDPETDKAYILYNSDAPDEKPLYSGHRTIRMFEFDYRRLEVIGEEKQLINGGVDLRKEPVWIEGPHILKKNNWYYLYCAEGGTGINHSQVVFRSKYIWGPYAPYDNNPILTQRDLPADRQNPITSAGHAQIVEGPDGKDYAVFLAVRPYRDDYYNTGRETFLAPVEWTWDWPVIHPGGKEIPYIHTFNFTESKPKDVRPQTGNFTHEIFFDKGIDPGLLFLRTIDYSSFSTSKKGLLLNLKEATVSEYTNPSFIGKRQQHMSSTVETELEFSPQTQNEKAGLVILQDEKHFYFLSKTSKEGHDVIQLLKSSNCTTEVLAEAALNSPKVKIGLKIVSGPESYSFYFSEDLKKWQPLKEQVDATFLSTKTAGGFLGCVYGMYATSTGEKSSNTACFRYLKYSGTDPVGR